MNKQIQLFHGSPSVVRVPDLSMSRTDIDFGPGFYLSPDFVTSAKWACRTIASICNEYIMSLNNLKVYTFELNKDWLDYVVRNRSEQSDTPNVFDKYDVLVGAIADDRLFHTIELYEDGLISAENAIKVMNCMNYGMQYVLKTERAIQNLQHISHVKILGKEKTTLKKQFQEDREDASKRTNQMLQELNGR